MGRLMRVHNRKPMSFNLDRSTGILICAGILVIIFGLSILRNEDQLTTVDVINQRTASEHLSENVNIRMTTIASKSLRIKLTSFDENIVYNDFNYLLPSSLTFTVRNYSNNIQIYHRLPKDRSTVGLLLIFHGCGRFAYDWFHTIERQRIIGAAIDLGLGCLAFQSTNTDSRCWSSNMEEHMNLDTEMVIRGLDGFLSKYPKLKTLPIFTFGASSGGIFSSIFALNGHFRVHGQVLFISFVNYPVLHSFHKYSQYPATAWIYMPRDVDFASEERINKSLDIFIKYRVPHIVYDIQPISLSRTTIHERIPSVNELTSEYIFQAFEKKQWLDENKRLIHNPREFDDWKSVMTPEVNSQNISNEIFQNLKENEIHLTEFIGTIYGEHAISFERSHEALTWLWSTYSRTREVPASFAKE